MEHFKILQGNMRTKDNFMREQGNKEPPYTALKYIEGQITSQNSVRDFCDFESHDFLL